MISKRSICLASFLLFSCDSSSIPRVVTDGLTGAKQGAKLGQKQFSTNLTTTDDYYRLLLKTIIINIINIIKLLKKLKNRKTFKNLKKIKKIKIFKKIKNLKIFKNLEFQELMFSSFLQL